MLSIGISEVLLIGLVFVLIVKPGDYQDILLAIRKLLSIILKTKSQISKEIDIVSQSLGAVSLKDEIINNLADGEIIDSEGNKHKFYKLDNIQSTKEQKS